MSGLRLYFYWVCQTRINLFLTSDGHGSTQSLVTSAHPFLGEIVLDLWEVCEPTIFFWRLNPTSSISVPDPQTKESNLYHIVLHCPYKPAVEYFVESKLLVAGHNGG